MRGARISLQLSQGSADPVIGGPITTPERVTSKETHMPFYLVVKPGVGDEAELVPDSPHGPQLVLDLNGARLSVQVNRCDPGGAELAAMFARDLATAAVRFAESCEDAAGLATTEIDEFEFDR
jgi:hypothetical protein